MERVAEPLPAPAVIPRPTAAREPKSGPATPTACSDGKDNDGDGLVDWQHDLGCYGPDDSTEGGLRTRELDHGWSVFEPSNDTRIIYVSSSKGNDQYLGTSSSKPKRTIAAALSAVRGGHPDWVLLARGDTWHESLTVKEGRSRAEPFVVATYGNETARPMLKTGPARGINRPRGNRYNNFAILGLRAFVHVYLLTSGKAVFLSVLAHQHLRAILLMDQVGRMLTKTIVLRPTVALGGWRSGNGLGA